MENSELIQNSLSTERQKTMQKYVLQKEAFGLPKGTIFVHDTEDSIRGSIGEGCLKLAWTDSGMCQKNAPCGGTYCLHAHVRHDVEWFRPQKSTRDNMKEKLIDILEGTIEQIKKL